MCDIYVGKCGKCGKEFEMHLGDFETRRDEIQVFCARCKPKDVNGVLWGFTDRYKSVWVVPLTDNAKNHVKLNRPNAALIEIFDNQVEGRVRRIE